MANIFEISTRGLQGARIASEVAANNIANAQTPGFSRQRAVFAEQVIHNNTVFGGLGVNVSTIERLRNEMIDSQILGKRNEIANLSARSGVYELMESVLINAPGAGLDAAISSFFDSFSELSNNPQDTALRNILISESQILVNTFNQIDTDLNELQDQALEKATAQIDGLNSILKEIASNNRLLIQAQSSPSGSNNALDNQQEILRKLADTIDFVSTVSDSGAVEIQIGGVVVVNGDRAQEIRAEIDTVNHNFQLRLPGGKKIAATQGNFAANIFMFTQGVPEAKEELNRITQAFVERVNGVHGNGFGIVDGGSRAFFDPDGTTAGTIKISDVIRENPGHIAASSVIAEFGNNDIAIEMAELRNERFINGQTINTRAVQFMSTPGIRLNEINTKLQAGDAALQFLTLQQEQVAGVSIDEELGNLIRHQNAFQASARVLEAGRQMLDTLISIV